MKQLDLTILNPTGLHARPAKTLVKVAKKFESKIVVRYGKRKANAKSMISVLTLGVPHEGVIVVEVDGADEDAAAVAITEAVQSGLGEGEHIAPPAATSVPAPESSAAAQEETLPEGAVKGIGASAGIAIGPLFKLEKLKVEVGTVEVGSVSAEKEKLQTAISQAQSEIETLRSQVQDKTGEESAEIFDAHLAILNDEDNQEAIHAKLEEGGGAAKSWQSVLSGLADQLAQSDNAILAGRAVDIRDVRDRVLGHLVEGGSGKNQLPTDPFVLVADDLTPSETASLDPNRVLALCTAVGGPTSHTAILARALGLPAVVGLGQEILSLENGKQTIVDGDAGTLLVSPSDEQVAAAEKQKAKVKAAQEQANLAAKDHAVTTDGKRIEIVANVGGGAEAVSASESGAEGIGLFRTEFLFLDRNDAPTEDEQFEQYKNALEALNGQPVIIRTLDIGGDKLVPYLDLPEEENPFLGERGIRLCLNRTDLFKTQLRALMRAAEFGNLHIMFPMVGNLSEWRTARQLAESVRAEVGGADVKYGIMIELPAAALLANKFAAEVDFFSVGTNDLTQYTLAIDRMHPTLAKQADGLNPAVLRLIGKTVKAAKAHGKWVGVCGELGSDPKAIPILVGLGVAELSVSVPAIAQTKAKVRTLDLKTAEALAKQALDCESAEQVRQLTK